jgi:PAS domain S-box-containing protein
MVKARSIPARVTLVYAIVAGAWILISSLLGFQLPWPWEIVFETTKGLAFVALTAFLLYQLIGRWTDALALESKSAAEARRQLQQVVDTTPMAIILVDGSHDVTFMNRAAEELMEVRAEQVIGTPLDELCGAGVRQEFAVSAGELLRTGSIDGMELPAGRGQRPKAVIARAAQLDPTHPESGWILALADQTAAQREYQRSARLAEGYRFVTEIAAAITRPRNAESLLGQLCDLATGVGGFKASFAVLADDEGAFHEAGTTGLREAGRRTAERIRAGGLQSCTLADELKAGTVVVNNDVAHGEDSRWKSVGAEEGLGSYAVFGIMQGGRLRAIVTLFAEAQGFFGFDERRLVETLRSVVGVAMDRHELDARRLDAEEALARSEANYRHLFDCNPQPMWVRDWETTRFLAVNDAAVEKYGYTREQFLDLTITDIRPESDVAEVMRSMNSRAFGQAYDGIWTHRDANGREFPVHLTTHAIAWGGRKAELVMIQEIAQVRQ